VKMVTGRKGGWQRPQEYLAGGVADTACRIVLSYHIADMAEQGWLARRNG
jgi:hypothetical protein